MQFADIHGLVIHYRWSDRGTGKPVRARAVTTFARGFEHPLALVVDPKGGLLVADWGRGVIYRIQSRGG